MSAFSSTQGRISAILGPTNTGKTHLALERMLGHRSGMIGFPLRLLARENYEKIVRLRGQHVVALITGEEKIIPPRATYFICTTESMPLDRLVAFLAIDEIQLCADPERGHIFTDRLLHARGLDETMFLGSDSIKPVLKNLIPSVEIITRPRFSVLTYTGPRKITRLPARTAIVAFSAADVYSIAELIRHQCGGAAVILGALSPRTRNAQIDLYQDREVDYIVATDAIGMGLNMNIDHVAFAALRKFDGRNPRALTAAEMAQIAGRAGRHMNNGTFGVTSDLADLDAETVAAIESHRFPPLKSLYWRNSDLRFTSIEALQASLTQFPKAIGLIKAREAADQAALTLLARETDIVDMARTPDRLKMLWDVCQIPDFRKNMTESHTRLLGTIFRHLCSRDGILPDEWLNAQIRRLDRIDGDIDTLMGRIAGIRIWTYIAYRSSWLNTPLLWQEQTRAIEDKLSDALHQRLSQRFIDRRTAVLLRHIQDRTPLETAITADGAIEVEGHFIGHLDGFRFLADKAESIRGTRAVSTAASQALRAEINTRIHRLYEAENNAFCLTNTHEIMWENAAIARITAGTDVTRPNIDIYETDLLESTGRQRIHERLSLWLKEYIVRTFFPLLAEHTNLAPALRATLFLLQEGLGSTPRLGVLEGHGDPIASLDTVGRKKLATFGIRFGNSYIYMPALLKPAAQQVRCVLWNVFHGHAPSAHSLCFGAVSLPLAPSSLPLALWQAIGYHPLGPVGIRLDIFEKWHALIRTAARKGPFSVCDTWPSILGVNRSTLALILVAMGYAEENGFYRQTHIIRKNQSPSKKKRYASSPDPNNPFAVLHTLKGS